MNAKPDIIAIGASAGGIEAISQLLAKLPEKLPATVLVVLHRPPDHVSYLQSILSRKTRLHVRIPREAEPLAHGICLVGEPDTHLIVGPDLRVHLLPNGFYRAHNVDALFCSLARHAGSRTIGVVLSGLLKDGTLGLRAIKEAGGVGLVQSPTEAIYSDMPLNAIAHGGTIDLVGTTDEIATEICKRVRLETMAATPIDQIDANYRPNQ